MKWLVSKKRFFRFKKVLSNNKGFTLVELMVVLVIMAIFSGIAIATFSSTIGVAKETAVTSNARAAYTAAQTLSTREFAASGFPSDDGIIDVSQTEIENVMGRPFKDGVTIIAGSDSREGVSLGGNLTTFTYTEDGITVNLKQDGSLEIDGGSDDDTGTSPPPSAT